MNDSFWAGFEKTALNATKARAIAAKHGLIPEGSWKWALRNLRKGKTREQLGQAPKKVIDAVKQKGSEVEAGKFWGKGSRGRGRVYTGTEHMVDIGGEGGALMKNKLFRAAVEGAGAASPRDMLKAHGRLTNVYKKHVDKAKHLNTIHTHPAASGESARAIEQRLLSGLRDAPLSLREEMSKHLDAAYRSHPLGHRLKKMQETNQKKVIDALETRYSSSHPQLQPSGFKSRSPYNVQGSDRQRFLLGNVGTHHNIVSPGSGVGVHTVRPDKQTGVNRLRSVLFKEGK